MSIKQVATDTLSKVKTYWKTPMAGRYMTFREIAAYSGGGIGAYMIITLGTACLLGTNNVLLSSTLGVAPMDMYVMYVLAVVINVLLTGVRANIIDNTRNKAGKYRPYIVSMAIPTAIIAITMVWFPYTMFNDMFGKAEIFGESASYVAKCAVIMVLNLLLHFFYYFFYDSYENLIHVLSPNSIERSDVAAIKSVVYSLAPSIINLIMPLIAQNVFDTNLTDIRVYRLVYPILAIGGILLCIIVYKYTEEKIVQARTHVVQIKFIDALKAVAKNKYFWIISLASWIGFLEAAYSNIMVWLYNYGGACSGNTYGLIITLYGNASLWGMLAAPFCIRKWGKKVVLVVTNIFNIICILSLMLYVDEITPNVTMWLVFSSMWLNALMGSFAHILNPAIQADIRDYQQYKTGERIDGMFSVVSTMGTVLALITSSVIPFIYKKNGITEENAKIVTSNPEVLSRLLGDGKTTVGEMLAQQAANGQDVYSNAYSALYDPNVLTSILKVLIIVAAFGALMNVIPYFWYDFNERKQKSVVRVLKIRAMFEDYGNGILNDGDLVEAVDYVRTAREMVNATPKNPSKKSYKGIKDKAERKAAKAQYKADLEYNEEIEIAKFVCDELDKFENIEFMYRYDEAQKTYAKGLNGLFTYDLAQAQAELAEAKAMAKDTAESKTIRKAAIELAKQKISSIKTIEKHFKATNKPFVEPKYADVEKCFQKEDSIAAKIKETNIAIKDANKAFSKHANQKNAEKVDALKLKLKKLQAEYKEAKKATKAETDSQAMFNRAAKPYIDAKKLVEQKANYSEFERIAEQYEVSKERHEKELIRKAAEEERKQKEEEALNAKIKAEKQAKKEAKKLAKKSK